MLRSLIVIAGISLVLMGGHKEVVGVKPVENRRVSTSFKDMVSTLGLRFRLDGVNYMFPLTVSDFLENGWSIIESEYVETVPARTKLGFILTNGKGVMKIIVSNKERHKVNTTDVSVCSVELPPSGSWVLKNDAYPGKSIARMDSVLAGVPLIEIDSHTKVAITQNVLYYFTDNRLAYVKIEL